MDSRERSADSEERRLLAGLRSGSNAGFDQVYEAYRPGVYGFLLRMTGRSALAEDLLQDVFLKLATRASVLAEDVSLKAWLFTVARNLVISNMRWRAAQSRNLDNFAVDETEERSLTPQHALEFNETHARLETALAKLAPKYREVLLLVAVEGLSPGESAQVLGIKGDAIRQRLARARKHLKCALEATPRSQKLQRRSQNDG